MISLETYQTNYNIHSHAFRVNPESCVHPEYYEEYLKFVAINDQFEGYGRTYILVNRDNDKTEIVGFFTLRATACILNDIDKPVSHPAIEISTLAVAHQYERKQLGRLMIHIVCALTNRLRRFIGVRYIVLRSDVRAVDFYKSCGFLEGGSWYNVPETNQNRECVPMYMKLSRLKEK